MRVVGERLSGRNQVHKQRQRTRQKHNQSRNQCQRCFGLFAVALATECTSKIQDDLSLSPSLSSHHTVCPLVCIMYFLVERVGSRLPRDYFLCEYSAESWNERAFVSRSLHTIRMDWIQRDGVKLGFSIFSSS